MRTERTPVQRWCTFCRRATPCRVFLKIDAWRCGRCNLVTTGQDACQDGYFPSGNIRPSRSAARG